MLMGRDFHFQNELNACRCQRATVAGFTRSIEGRQFFQTRERTTQKSRSVGRSLGCLKLVWSSASCWRRVRFSRTGSERPSRRVRKKARKEGRDKGQRYIPEVGMWWNLRKAASMRSV